MSIITIASTKGGAGKTTLARLILARLVPTGLRLAAIDADYNRTLTDWLASTEVGHTVTIRHELEADAIVPLATDLHERHDVLVIDTAGAAATSTVYAIGCADLVLVPLQPSAADVIEAIKTCNHIKSAELMLKRPVLARVVLMAVQPITNMADRIYTEVTKAGLPLMQARLGRLVAFQEMSFTGIAPVAGTAGEQATALMQELADLGVIPPPQPINIAS